MKPLGAGETCAFLPADAASPGCRQPRACVSCLETTDCVVTAVGACTSLSDAVLDTSSLDYHTAIERDVVGSDEATATRQRMRASQSWQFSASDVRYCNASDAGCGACVSNNFWRSNATAPDSRFCLGDGGACVCIDVCERPWYIREDCSRGGGGASAVAGVLPGEYESAEYDDTTEKLWRGIMALAAISFILMLIFLRKKCSDEELLRVRRLHARQARQARRNLRSRAIGVNVLTLTGWESYRRDLIDKEKQRQQQEADDVEGRSRAQSEWSPSRIAERSSEVVGANVPAADRSPSATNVNESGETETPSIGSPTSGARPALSGSRASRLATYNEATPSQQLLRPLQERAFGRSDT